MGKTKEEILRRVNEGFIEGVPHNGAMGMRVTDFGEGYAVSEVPYRQDLVGNPDNGVLHGGVVTAAIDATCGAAVLMKLGRRTRIATLDLRIDYLKPATPGKTLVTRADCFKLTRQVAFVRAIAHHGDLDDPIASAAGTFMIFRQGRSSLAEAVHVE